MTTFDGLIIRARLSDAVQEVADDMNPRQRREIAWDMFKTLLDGVAAQRRANEGPRQVRVAEEGDKG